MWLEPHKPRAGLIERLHGNSLLCIAIVQLGSGVGCCDILCLMWFCRGLHLAAYSRSHDAFLLRVLLSHVDDIGGIDDVRVLSLPAFHKKQRDMRSLCSLPEVSIRQWKALLCRLGVDARWKQVSSCQSCQSCQVSHVQAYPETCTTLAIFIGNAQSALAEGVPILCAQSWLEEEPYTSINQEIKSHDC